MIVKREELVDRLVRLYEESMPPKIRKLLLDYEFPQELAGE